jgi:hypothetical protein
MDDHSGRLVDHEQVLVLVGDPQFALLRRERLLLALDDVDLDELSALEAVAFRPPFAVHEDRAAGEESLSFCAGADLGQCGHKAIEAFAGGLVWNREP